MKIWRAACFSRVLTLTYEASTDSFPQCSQPVLLSTSREAREEALHIYTLFFGTKTQPARIYFSPHLDTIYVPRYGQMGYDDTLRDFRDLIVDKAKLLDELRHVAIDHVNIEIKRPWESYNKATFLRRFNNLEEVTLVLENKSLPTSNSTNKPIEIALQEPQGDPERQLKIWYYFRQTFLVEERLLEDACKDGGREYNAYSLPTVRIKSKAPIRRLTLSEGVESLQSALQRTKI